jgi:hypothetical protein
MRYQQEITRVVLLCLLVGAIPSLAQKRPDLGPRPAFVPGRVEIHFAVGDESVFCQSFSLTVRQANKVLVKGRFSSSFPPPPQAAGVSDNETLNIQLGCGSHRWYFRRVSSHALSQGRWWVGTDYPPFQSEFAGPKFAACRAIRYLIVEPSEHTGFDYFETTPATLDESHQACTGK